MQRFLYLFMTFLLYPWTGNAQNGISITNGYGKPLNISISWPVKKSKTFSQRVETGKSADVYYNEILALNPKGLRSDQPWFVISGKNAGRGMKYSSQCYIDASIVNMDHQKNFYITFVGKHTRHGIHATCLCPKEAMNRTCFKDRRCMQPSAQSTVAKCHHNISPTAA